MKQKKQKTNNRFICLDFETANPCRDSVCSIGFVIVENNKITEKFYTLINPMTTYFNKYCVATHGITYKDVVCAPSFEEIWEHIDKIIGDSPIVAHNVPFEKSCLKACSDKFGTNADYKYICTLKLSRKVYKEMKSHKLNLVCEACGFKLKNHHNALADAEACAKILIDFMKNKKVKL